MKLFTDGTDYVIAEDVDDAWVQWSEHTGEEREDYDDGEKVWEEWPPDKMLPIWCDANGAICEVDEDGGELVGKKGAEWIAKEGRGWLASTEH